MIRNNLETRLAKMLKNSMTSHVLDGKPEDVKTPVKTVIVANRLQYVYNGYTRPVGSERVKEGHIRTIPAKFGQNPSSSLDVLTTDDT